MFINLIIVSFVTLVRCWGVGRGEREYERERERERERGGNLYAYLHPLPDILLKSILASKLIEKSGTLSEVKQKISNTLKAQKH